MVENHAPWEKRLRTRPGRVRFFKFYRAGRVRDASAAVSPCALNEELCAFVRNPAKRSTPPVRAGPRSMRRCDRNRYWQVSGRQLADDLQPRDSRVAGGVADGWQVAGVMLA
eukprot:gene8757-biopygen115